MTQLHPADAHQTRFNIPSTAGMTERMSDSAARRWATTPTDAACCAKAAAATSASAAALSDEEDGVSAGLPSSKPSIAATRCDQPCCCSGAAAAAATTVASGGEEVEAASVGTEAIPLPLFDGSDVEGPASTLAALLLAGATDTCPAASPPRMLAGSAASMRLRISIVADMAMEFRTMFRGRQTMKKKAMMAW